MNREEVIRMAREAGAGTGKLYPRDNEETILPNQMDVFRFASLVAAAERERCAKVCEETDKSGWPGNPEYGLYGEFADCAAAIRALD